MFTIHEIEVDSSYVELNPLIKEIHHFSDFLLIPARYLFNGKTISLHTISTTSKLVGVNIVPSYPQSERNLLKTISAIICLAPGIILGGFLKLGLMLVSRKIDQAYSVAKLIDINNSRAHVMAFAVVNRNL